MIPQVKTQFSLSQKNSLVIETLLWKSDVPKTDSANVRCLKSYFDNFIVNGSLGRFYKYFLPPSPFIFYTLFC